MTSFPDTGTIIISLSVLSFSSFIHGYTGFGFGIVSMLLFTIFSSTISYFSIVTTSISLFLYLSLTLFNIKKSKPRWKDILLLLTGCTIGMPFGFYFLLHYENSYLFKIFFGVMLVLFSIYKIFLSNRVIHTKNWTAPIFGLFSGVLGGAFVSGGPPLIIYLFSRTKDPREMKTSLNIIFLCMSITRLTTIKTSSLSFGTDILYLTAICLPVCIAIQYGANKLTARGSAELFKKVSFILIGLSGLVLSAKGLSALL